MEELWLPAVFRGVCLPFWVLVSLPCLLLLLCQLSWRLEDKILPPIRFQPGYRVVGTFLVMAANRHCPIPLPIFQAGAERAVPGL